MPATSAASLVVVAGADAKLRGGTLALAPNGDVWSLWCADTGTSVLRRVRTTLTVDDFPVEDPPPSCTWGTTFAFAPEGTVWVRSAYRILQWTPGSRTVKTYSLPTAVEGALPAALDADGPYPAAGSAPSR